MHDIILYLILHARLTFVPYCTATAPNHDCNLQKMYDPNCLNLTSVDIYLMSYLNNKYSSKLLNYIVVFPPDTALNIYEQDFFMQL